MPERRLIHWSEIEGYARSPFSKEQADLVLLGKPDSSGIPVEERRADIAEQHGYNPVVLVPVELLESIIHTLKESSQQYDELLQFTAPLIKESEIGKRAQRLIDLANKIE